MLNHPRSSSFVVSRCSSSFVANSKFKQGSLSWLTLGWLTRIVLHDFYWKREQFAQLIVSFSRKIKLDEVRLCAYLNIRCSDVRNTCRSDVVHRSLIDEPYGRPSMSMEGIQRHMVSKADRLKYLQPQRKAVPKPPFYRPSSI